MATSDETQVQTSKPDSKDFVEHLRTIHFSLVSVCLALIVILQFPSPVPIREAISQLNTIIDVTNQWKTNWLDLATPAQLGKEQDFAHCIQPVLPAFTTITDKGKRIFITFEAANWTIRKPDLTAITMNGPQRETSVKQPQRLDEFIDTWNTKYSVICPLRIADEAVYQLSVGPSNPLPSVVQMKHELFSPTSLQVTASLSDGTINQKFSGLHKQQNAESQGLFYSLNINPPQVATYKQIQSFEIDWRNLAGIEVPVLESKVFSLDFKAWLVDRFPQHHWIHADFKNAFYELNQATVGFQDVDFIHIKNILLQNEKSSKEAFQAFGVTFPIETTTRWGTLIIIAIQFYFLLHFMEYRKRPTLVKPDIAWIGIYTSIGARVLFCGTALALPLAVITFVCIKAGLLPQMPARNFMLCTTAVILSLLFAALTGKEYFRKVMAT